MVCHKQCKRAEAQVLTGPEDRSATVSPRPAGRTIAFVIVLLLAGDSAFGQLLVQPMVLKKPVQPGRRYTVELKIENLDQQAGDVLTLDLTELTQKPDATWMELRSDDPNLSKFTLRSCKSWLTVPSGQISVGPYQVVPFNVMINVPSGTRGFYFAALVATTVPRQMEAVGVESAVNIEILVPVVLEVQNLVVKREVALTGVGLEFHPQTMTSEAASVVTMDIANTGGTFSRLLPIVRVWGQAGGHWREISEVQFRETGVIPGVTLHLTQDAGRPLASGPYRLEGFLFVDGRRGGRLQKDVQFEGDKRVINTVGEAPIDVQPSEVLIEALPGSTRAGSITVVNGSEEAVNVDVELGIPENMQYVVSGAGVRGEELSCADWVTVEPRRFPLRGYSRRTLSLVARMPNPAGKYPTYYGQLKLRASFPDGQLGGTRDGYICVQNRQVPPVPEIGSAVLTVSELSASRYLATATFLNTGVTHLIPSCQGALSLPGQAGTGVMKKFLMSSEAYGQRGILIPFMSRSFSGILDISDVQPGRYRVTAILKWAGGPEDGRQDQRAIEVTEQGGRKFMRMVDINQVGGTQVIQL